jgi:hypothetical protein
MQTYPSFKTKTNPVERKSRTLSFNGSPSFSYFRAKTNRARAKRLYERTTTASDFSSTSPSRTTCLVWKIKDRMRERNDQPHDLVFPNGEGKPDGHFLRKLKAIAKKAGVEGAELHRFRKTYADTLHEEGVSVNTAGGFWLTKLRSPVFVFRPLVSELLVTR